jgi:hypothetical protein
MAEVLLKCVIRETKSIYHKFYVKYKFVLFCVLWITGSLVVGFGAAAFAIWLNKILQENMQIVMMFVNAVMMVAHAIYWCIGGICAVIMSGIFYVISLPFWFTGLVVFLMISVGYPVTKAFVICVKRARNSTSGVS